MRVGRRDLLLTHCHAILGGAEIALLRHLDFSCVPRDRIVVALLNHGPLVHEVRARGIECVILGRNNRGGFFPGGKELMMVAGQMAGLIAWRGIRYVLAWCRTNLQPAMTARRVVPFRLAWRSQGDITEHALDRPLDKTAAQFIRRVARIVDMTVPATDWDARGLVRFGVPRERVRVVPFGIDDSWFGSASEDSLNQDRPLRVIVVARLDPVKRHKVFLDAFAAAVAATRIPVHAWIVGDGPPHYRHDLEHHALHLGIAPLVRFLGHRADVRELMQQSDVAMLCSATEGFGLAIVEAMAAGLPVVAPDVLGPREIVTPGATGILVDPADLGGFADALKQLVGDKRLRAALGRHAREDAARRFRASVNVERVERLLLGPASTWFGSDGHVPVAA